MSRAEHAREGRESKTAVDTTVESTERADDYQAPEVVVHDGDAFVKRLGPAQACTGAG